MIRFASLSNGLNVAELFHGPTLAFKDLSLGVVGQLINYFLEKRQKHMTILIGEEFVIIKNDKLGKENCSTPEDYVLGLAYSHI